MMATVTGVDRRGARPRSQAAAQSSSNVIVEGFLPSLPSGRLILLHWRINSEEQSWS